MFTQVIPQISCTVCLSVLCLYSLDSVCQYWYPGNILLLSIFTNLSSVIHTSGLTKLITLMLFHTNLAKQLGGMPKRTGLCWDLSPSHWSLVPDDDRAWQILMPSKRCCRIFDCFPTYWGIYCLPGVQNFRASIKIPRTFCLYAASSQASLLKALWTMWFEAKQLF